MIRDLIAGAIGNYMITCFVLGLLVAGVQTARWKRARTGAVISGLFLNAFVLWAIGVSQVINFFMHSVLGDYAAKSIGWAQSPFQLELALSSLGVGVIAIVVHGRMTQLRAKAAVIVGSAVFGLGAAAGHIYHTVVDHDHALNNGGLLLFGDIVINLVGLGLLLWHAAARRDETIHATDAAVVAPANTPLPRPGADLGAVTDDQAVLAQ